MRLEYVQNAVHHPLAGRDCSTPDASEIEPRGRRDTKSRELRCSKLDIYSEQGYGKQRKEKGGSRAEAGALHCKVLDKVAIEQHNARKVS